MYDIKDGANFEQVRFCSYIIIAKTNISNRYHTNNLTLFMQMVEAVRFNYFKEINIDLIPEASDVMIAFDKILVPRFNKVSVCKEIYQNSVSYTQSKYDYSNV